MSFSITMPAPWWRTLLASGSCLPVSPASATMAVQEAARSSTGSSTAPWQHVEASVLSMMGRRQTSADAACHNL